MHVSSPHWIRCLWVSCMTLVGVVMLASFQLPPHAQRKERPVKDRCTEVTHRHITALVIVAANAVGAK
jgi:hypothetical protein